MSDHEWKVGDTAYRAVIDDGGEVKVIEDVVDHVSGRTSVWINGDAWLISELVIEVTKTPKDALWNLLRELEREKAAAEREVNRIDRQTMAVAERIAAAKADKGK
jgi:hypothetical protein